ncbi:MAG: hypothetical protein M3R38_11695 [Actinomycetota bacterium]|nr:hypothetical protein [Actinomycetota bacterium]MDP9485362.1 hypothetical protein [Actinomycetota bacterium]
MVRKEQRPKRSRRSRRPGDHAEPARASCPDSPEKAPYRSLRAAEAAMMKAQDLAASGDEVPVRAYECPGCAAWHVTKHTQWRKRA